MLEHHHNNVFDRKKRFVFVIILNFFISFAELFAGIISNSLALVSDAFHNLEDALSVVISYIAWIFSFKKPTQTMTFGYKRAEVIAAFVNSIFLSVISFFVIIEGIKRYFTPQSINSEVMIYASAAAFFVNMVSAIMLHKDSHSSMNLKSAYLHMIGDALFSFSVVIGAFLIKYYSIAWIDPLLSCIIGFVMIYQSSRIFKRSFKILMQSSANLDYEAIKKDIESIDGVRNVHHVHSWFNGEDEIYFELHIDVSDMKVSQSCVILNTIEKLLKTKYKVSHATIQIETDLCSDKNMFKNCCD